MATATFKLFGLRVTDLLARVREIITKLTDNVAVYPTPNPTTIVLAVKADALDLSNQQALNGDRIKKQQMRLDRKALLQDMNTLQTYVQLTSGGDPAKILLVADVRRAPSPAGIKPPPGNIRTKFGYLSGQIKLLYAGVKARSFYRVQVNPTPGNNATWIDYVQTTKVRVLISGLVSTQEYAIRVATVTPEGMGEWSDPIIQKAL